MKLALNLTESLDSILSREFLTLIVYLEHEFTLNRELSCMAKAEHSVIQQINVLSTCILTHFYTS